MQINLTKHTEIILKEVAGRTNHSVEEIAEYIVDGFVQVNSMVELEKIFRRGNGL